MQAVSTFEELKQKDREILLNNAKAEIEVVRKDYKVLSEQTVGLKSENGALKEKVNLYAEGYQSREEKFKTMKLLLARIGEYNILLYTVIREFSGEQVSTNEFFKLQDRKNRLKQLSEGIEELHVLNELYSFITNKPLTNAATSPKSKDVLLTMFPRNKSDGKVELSPRRAAYVKSSTASLLTVSPQKMSTLTSPKTATHSANKKADFTRVFTFQNNDEEETSASNALKNSTYSKNSTARSRNGNNMQTEAVINGKEQSSLKQKSTYSNIAQKRANTGDKLRSSLGSPAFKK